MLQHFLHCWQPLQQLRVAASEAGRYATAHRGHPVLLLLTLILENARQCKVGRERLTPYTSTVQNPSPTNQLRERENSRRRKGSEQHKALKKNWLCYKKNTESIYLERPIIKYQPGLRQDTGRLRSCSEKRTKLLLKAKFESKVNSEYIKVIPPPAAQFHKMY